MQNIPKYIIIHHSYTPRDLDATLSEQSFNRNHRSRQFPSAEFGGKTWYIGYHYVIYGDGELRQYRSHNTVGAHTKEQKMNMQSIGICLVGNFDEEDPSEAQLETLRDLVAELQNDYSIPAENIKPHRHYATYKSCYGSKLPDDPNELLRRHWSEEAMNWAREHRIIEAPHQPEEQVHWGESVAAFKNLADRVIDWSDDET